MLVEFSVSNFWSFKALQVLPMQAAKIVSKDSRLDRQNTLVVSDDLSLLKTKGIFGANASGKSNVVKAMLGMLTIVDLCFTKNNIIQEAVVPFHLNVETPNEPTFFQLVFTLEGMVYRYGFEVHRNAVVSEWLFGKPLRRGSSKKLTEKYFFKREGMNVSVNQATFSEGKRFESSDQLNGQVYRVNALFLRVVAALNGTLSQKICHYFNLIGFVSEYPDKEFYVRANARLADSVFLEKVSALIRAVDPSAHKVSARSVSRNGAQEGWEPLIHRNYSNGKEVVFPLLGIEAEGTKKLFGMSPFIFDSLAEGLVLVVDEFDARLHPKLTRKVIDLFHSPHTNPKGAQLIFVSHDSHLLDHTLLRRDQILFADKGQDGATELYSLVQVKGVRNDSAYEREYLLGRYKAVPNNLNALEEPFKPYGNAETDESGKEDQ